MDEQTEHGPGQQRSRDPRRRRRIVLAIVVLAAVLLVIVVLQVMSGGDGFSTIDQASGDWAYLTVFLLVFGDALCALFPGETTLNAASTLASQGMLNLWLVMLAGRPEPSAVTRRCTGSPATTGTGSSPGWTRR
jgi:hypothetical protein